MKSLYVDIIKYSQSNIKINQKSLVHCKNVYDDQATCIEINERDLLLFE